MTRRGGGRIAGVLGGQAAEHGQRPACCEDAPHVCPGCQRVMSHREAAEQGLCNECQGGWVHVPPAHVRAEAWARMAPLIARTTGRKKLEVFGH